MPDAKTMHEPLPDTTLVDEHKEMEERLLRHLDLLRDASVGIGAPIDGRWLSIARTHFEQGFMALNRAVLQPQRISLPEDKGSE
jgi:hypothetical protein